MVAGVALGLATGDGLPVRMVLRATFFAWLDELVYHRRRAVHREDLMHTVSHLAGGAMLTAFYAMRLTRLAGDLQ